MKWDAELEQMSRDVIDRFGDEALAAATDRAFKAVAKAGQVETDGALEDALRSELRQVLRVQ